MHGRLPAEPHAVALVQQADAVRGVPRGRAAPSGRARPVPPCRRRAASGWRWSAGRTSWRGRSPVPPNSTRCARPAGRCSPGCARGVRPRSRPSGSSAGRTTASDRGRGLLGQEVEEPLVQVPETGQGVHQLPDELAVAAVQVRVDGPLDDRSPVLVDEPGGEPVVPAAVVEVVVGVEGEHVVAGQFLGHLPDVADAQARVDQGRGRAALDQEAVHVHGLADQEDARLQPPGGKPVSHGSVSSSWPT